MSLRLLHRNATGSNAISTLRRPHSLHTPTKLNRAPRAQFHYSSANGASATSSAKVFPSLGKATAQELVKKLESGDAKLQLTIQDKEQLEKFTLTSYTSQRSNTVTELGRLVETITAATKEFESIKASIKKIDDKGGLVQDGKRVTFLEKWTKLQEEYTSLIRASQDEATSTRNAINQFINTVVPAFQDGKSDEAKQLVIDTYTARIRTFEAAGRLKEDRFRRLRADVEMFRKDVLSTVDDNKKELGTEREVLDRKLAKLEKELEKSKSMFDGWTSGSGPDRKQLLSERDKLHTKRTSVTSKIDGIDALKVNDVDETMTTLLGRLTAVHGIWRMLDSDAQTLREDFGAVQSAHQTKIKDYIKSNEYALFVTYELFNSALNAYCLAVDEGTKGWPKQQ
ncbi:hypothetical protein BJ165DRAFT_1468803 [Panaeolus papilionaceus]|nr:hypothetical protein BJ165DRAFT_1468803 [Panaeolus papilionaceus]